MSEYGIKSIAYKAELFDPNAKSNCPHPHPFVVQAFNTGQGWVDSSHGDVNAAKAEEKAKELLKTESFWIGGIPGKLRIVERLRKSE